MKTTHVKVLHIGCFSTTHEGLLVVTGQKLACYIKKGVHYFCDDNDKLNVKSTKNALPMCPCYVSCTVSCIELGQVLVAASCSGCSMFTY